MPLNDNEIRRRCGGADRTDPGSDFYLSNPMVTPFVDEKTKEGALSYGLGHFGYDIRIGDMLRLPQPRKTRSYIDPLNSEDVEKQCFQDVDISGSKQYCMRPGEFILTGTLEYFRIPADIVAIVHDKSTLARLGIAVQNTILEPGWNGYLTMEITNHGVHSIMLSAHMPIAQVIFYKGEIPCKAYTGRYQDQEFAAPAKG